MEILNLSTEFDNKKMIILTCLLTAVRKVYQRGCLNPMGGVEALWKDYCAYENGVNPLIAKKMIDDRFRDWWHSLIGRNEQSGFEIRFLLELCYFDLKCHRVFYGW